MVTEVLPADMPSIRRPFRKVIRTHDDDRISWESADPSVAEPHRLKDANGKDTGRTFLVEAKKPVLVFFIVLVFIGIVLAVPVRIVPVSGGGIGGIASGGGRFGYGESGQHSSVDNPLGQYHERNHDYS